MKRDENLTLEFTDGASPDRQHGAPYSRSGLAWPVISRELRPTSLPLLPNGL